MCRPKHIDVYAQLSKELGRNPAQDHLSCFKLGGENYFDKCKVYRTTNWCKLPLW